MFNALSVAFLCLTVCVFFRQVDAGVDFVLGGGVVLLSQKGVVLRVYNAVPDNLRLLNRVVVGQGVNSSGIPSEKVYCFKSALCANAVYPAKQERTIAAEIITAMIFSEIFFITSLRFIT